MTAFVTAGAGFLLAVLWFDLMFDVQTLRQPPGDLPEPVLASISAYYARVTTAARPMNRLISLVMLATTVALIVQLTGDDAPDWAAAGSLACALAAIGLAGAHTVPSAVRLGRADRRHRRADAARAGGHARPPDLHRGDRQRARTAARACDVAVTALVQTSRESRSPRSRRSIVNAIAPPISGIQKRIRR